MPEDYQEIRQTIYSLTGIQIGEDKIYLIDTRLNDLLIEYGLSSFREVARKMKADGEGAFTQKVIDKITTNETHFFRDRDVIRALIEQIIPEWMKRKNIQPFTATAERLDIWSAGCSSGQEPYSITMSIYERWPGFQAVVHLLATDISNQMLEKARRGFYSNFEIGRGLSEENLKKYFDPADGGYQLKEHIRNKVSFQYHNLISPAHTGQFDVIFCRNVMIYFSEEQKKKVIEKIRNSLKPDGVLILGSAESLAGYVENYIVRNYGLMHYYELNPSRVTFF